MLGWIGTIAGLLTTTSFASDIKLAQGTIVQTLTNEVPSLASISTNECEQSLTKNNRALTGAEIIGKALDLLDQKDDLLPSSGEFDTEVDQHIDELGLIDVKILRAAAQLKPLLNAGVVYQAIAEQFFAMGFTTKEEMRGLANKVRLLSKEEKLKIVDGILGHILGHISDQLSIQTAKSFGDEANRLKMNEEQYATLIRKWRAMAPNGFIEVKLALLDLFHKKDRHHRNEISRDFVDGILKGRQRFHSFLGRVNESYAFAGYLAEYTDLQEIELSDFDRLPKRYSQPQSFSSNSLFITDSAPKINLHRWFIHQHFTRFTWAELKNPDLTNFIEKHMPSYTQKLKERIKIMDQIWQLAETLRLEPTPKSVSVGEQLLADLQQVRSDLRNAKACLNELDKGWPDLVLRRIKESVNSIPTDSELLFEIIKQTFVVHTKYLSDTELMSFALKFVRFHPARMPTDYIKIIKLVRQTAALRNLSPQNIQKLEKEVSDYLKVQTFKVQLEIQNHMDWVQAELDLSPEETALLQTVLSEKERNDALIPATQQLRAEREKEITTLEKKLSETTVKLELYKTQFHANQHVKIENIKNQIQILLDKLGFLIPREKFINITSF